MLSPTPLLRPSPLDVGSVFSGAFSILRRRFGLFLVLSLFPTLVALGTGLAALLLFLSSLLPMVINARSGSVLPQDILRAGAGLLFGYLVAVIVTWLVQVKAQGMMSLAAYEVAQGQSPNFRGVMSRTRGFLPRIVPVQFVIGLAVAVAYALFVAGFVTVAAASSGRNSNNAGAVILLMIGGIVTAVVVAIFLGVRWLYLTPAVAIEQIGGFAGLGRSWRLTKGAFWRTFGYNLLAGLVVGSISMALSFATQSLGGAITGELSNQTDPRVVLAAMAPMLIASLGAQGIVQLFATPFVTAYQTVMFLDQVRRAEEPSAPPTWFAPGQPPAGPGWPPAPQQPWTPDPGAQWGQSPQQAQQSWGGAPQAPWGQAPAQPQAAWGQAPQAPAQTWGQAPAQPPQPWASAPQAAPVAQPWVRPDAPAASPVAEPTPPPAPASQTEPRPPAPEAPDTGTPPPAPPSA